MAPPGFCPAALLVIAKRRNEEVTMVERVTATPEALTMIEKLSASHGPLLFHQSGGCCDGSAPMCYPRGEFRVASKMSISAPSAASRSTSGRLSSSTGSTPISSSISCRDAGRAFRSKRPRASVFSRGRACSRTRSMPSSKDLGRRRQACSTRRRESSCGRVGVEAIFGRDA